MKVFGQLARCRLYWNNFFFRWVWNLGEWWRGYVGGSEGEGERNERSEGRERAAAWALMGGQAGKKGKRQPGRVRKLRPAQVEMDPRKGKPNAHLNGGRTNC